MMREVKAKRRETVGNACLALEQAIQYRVERRVTAREAQHHGRLPAVEPAHKQGKGRGDVTTGVHEVPPS